MATVAAVMESTPWSTLRRCSPHGRARAASRRGWPGYTAPRLQRFGGHQGIERRAGGGPEQRRGALARGLPTDAIAATLHAACFHQHRCGRADFATQREALQQPPRHDDGGPPGARHRIGRRTGDAQRSHDHQADGQGHGGLAAAAVGVAADHETSERAHHEPDAERRDGQQQRRIGAGGGKEQLADHDGKEAVDGEVVHFQRITDRTRGDHARLVGREGLCACKGSRGAKGCVIHENCREQVNEPLIRSTDTIHRCEPLKRIARPADGPLHLARRVPLRPWAQYSWIPHPCKIDNSHRENLWLSRARCGQIELSHAPSSCPGHQWQAANPGHSHGRGITTVPHIREHSRTRNTPSLHSSLFPYADPCAAFL